jgi:glutamate-1-semialdehyde 2,1-aminomutase
VLARTLTQDGACEAAVGGGFVTSRKTLDLLAHNRAYIPGGVSSANRIISPPIAFVRGQGAHLWDIDGNRYIDYHAGFAPYLLGHNFEPVNRAAVDALAGGDSLFGAGYSVLEGQFAELICRNVSSVERVTLLNTGSEATSLAVRLSRAVTARQHVIIIQGSYNGNHDELACNVFNTLDEIGPRVSPGEYPLRPLGAGTTVERSGLIHVVNFNDLDSVRYVCDRYPVAALITEPVLQNIGVVRPAAGYLHGLRTLADEYGFLLILDEVKTGFRHGLGGYSRKSGVRPDLVVFGKAIANGFPLAVVGGRAEYMDFLCHDDPSRRPFVAGTYNGHPVAVAAAMRTVQYLIEHETAVYAHLEAMGASLQSGMEQVFRRHQVEGCVVREGSALSFYLMPEPPSDLHDIILRHDFEKDVRLRKELIAGGVFVVPIATKQWSISAAHTAEDIGFTLGQFERAVAAVQAGQDGKLARDATLRVSASGTA